MVLLIQKGNLVLAFSSEYCSHGEIELELQESLNCITKLVFKEEAKNKTVFAPQLFDTYNTKEDQIQECKFLIDCNFCFLQHLGVCFDERQNNEIVYIFDLLMRNIFGIKCNRKEYSDVVHTGHQNASEVKNPSNEDLQFPLSFDQPCPKEKLIRTFLHDFYPCCENYLKDLFSHVIQFGLNIFIRNREVSTNCQDLLLFLNCFKANECISESELDVTKNFLFSYYTIHVHYAKKTVDNFMKKVAEGEQVEVGPEYVTILLASLIAEDYKVFHFIDIRHEL